MAITEDTANQPAALQWTGAWTTAQTTASFSPQANTLLVALLAADGSGASTTTGAITDSVGGSTGWSVLARSNGQNGSVGGTAEVWIKYLASAPGSMTVSATGSGGASTGGQLVVRSLLGAETAANQTGAVGTFFDTAGTALSVSVAAGTGNMIYGAIVDFTSAVTLAMLANTTSISNFADTTNGDTWAAVKSSAATAGTATYGSSTTATGQVAMAEIIAVAGAAATATPQPIVVPNAAVHRSATW